MPVHLGSFDHRRRTHNLSSPEVDGGEAWVARPVEDIDVEDQLTIEALRSALRSARDFIAAHPAVRGEWPLLLAHIDSALAERATTRRNPR